MTSSFAKNWSGLLAAAVIVIAAALGAPAQSAPDSAGELLRAWTAESLAAAEPLLAESAAAGASGGDARGWARAVVRLAELRYWLDRPRDSERTLRDALAAPAGRIPAARVELLTELSIRLTAEGRADEVSRIVDEALAIADDPEARASAIFARAEMLYWRSDLTVARDEYARARALVPEGGAGDALRARIDLSLGYLLIEMNDFEAAEVRIAGAESYWRAVGDRRGAALALRARGALLAWTDEKRRAIEAYRQAESMFPPDVESAEKTALYGVIGAEFEDLGDYESSRFSRERALEAARRVGNVVGEEIVVTDLARVAYLAGDETGAEAFLERASALAAELGDEFFINQAIRLRADIRLNSGRLDEAERLYRVALTYFRSRQKPREEGKTTERLGEIRRRAGDLKGARALFVESLETARRIRDRLAESQALYQLARLEMSGGAPAKAAELVRESIRLTDGFAVDTVSSRLKRAFMASVYDRYELYVKSLAAAPDADAALASLVAAERGRARMIREETALAASPPDEESAENERRLTAALNAETDRLTDMLSRNAADPGRAALERRINDLHNRLDEARAAAREAVPGYDPERNRDDFDLAGFRRRYLADGSALVEFSLGADESFAWLVTSDDLRLARLPGRAAVEAKIAAFAEALAARAPLPDEDLDAFRARSATVADRLDAALRELSEMLLGQFADRLRGGRLIIVADGGLIGVPFAALPVPAGAAALRPALVDNHEIVFTPSAMTLAAISDRPHAEAAQKDLLLLSDPVFSADDPRLGGTPAESGAERKKPAETFRFAASFDDLPRLAGSRDESDEVGRIVGGRSGYLTGFDASRDALLAAGAPDYRVIHFATHGLIDVRRPEMSGIILSRFDRGGDRLDESIRLHDVYGFKLNADLVVLSACRTAVGKEYRGEGLASFDNAFLQAGARNVVSTLWQVEDGATVEFMKHFYSAMVGEKLAPPAALRRAQLALRENPRYRSPFYWAAFTVHGDPSRHPAIAPAAGVAAPMLALPIAVALLLAAAVATFVYRRRAK